MSVEPDILSVFDEWVVDHAMRRYEMSEDEAIRRVLTSQTHEMLADAETLLWGESPLVAIDMFDNEIANGDPRFSAYIQGTVFMYADKLPHETEFFLYLLEHYAARRDRDAGAMPSRSTTRRLSPTSTRCSA